MLKKTDEQLGRLLTHEIVSMIQDKSLKDADVGLLIRAIIGFKTIKQGYLASFANSLKSGFIEENRKYIEGINKRRERNRKAEANRRELANSARDDRPTSAHVRTCPCKEKGKEKNNIPLPPKGGKGGNVPSAVSPDDLLKETRLGDCEKWAWNITNEIALWYPYEVNPEGLKKILMVKFKKNLARALENGIAAWRKSGAWDEKRFVPPDIVKWIKLERFLDEPPQKKSPAARADGGRALAAPSADATMRMIESEGEEE